MTDDIQEQPLFREPTVRKLTVGKYTVEVDLTTGEGLFEHIEYGEDVGGSGCLYFEDGKLVDFYGMFVLPKDVAEAIQQMGLVVDVPYSCE